MSTPDQIVADKIGSEIDGRIAQLQGEKQRLLGAASRIVDINAELAVLQTEKARIDGRRPPVNVNSTIDSTQPVRVK